MNSLIRNKIKMNWADAYYGYKNNWLSIEEIDKLAFQGKFGYCPENLLIELDISKDDRKEKNMAILDKILNYLYVSSDKNKLLIKAEKKWIIGFMIDIKKSVKEKLEDIATLRENIGQPEDWKNFIYYLPADKNEEVGEEIIFF